MDIQQGESFIKRWSGTIKGAVAIIAISILFIIGVTVWDSIMTHCSDNRTTAAMQKDTTAAGNAYRLSIDLGLQKHITDSLMAPLVDQRAVLKTKAVFAHAQLTVVETELPDTQSTVIKSSVALLDSQQANSDKLIDTLAKDTTTQAERIALLAPEIPKLSAALAKSAHQVIEGNEELHTAHVHELWIGLTAAALAVALFFSLHH